MSGKKFYLQRFEKSKSYPNQITQPLYPTPSKVKQSAPKVASYLYWYPGGVHTKNPVRTWAMVKRFPTIPSHAEVECLFYDEHSSRQEGGSQCCRCRCGERSSSTRFIELFASLKVGTSYNFFTQYVDLMQKKYITYWNHTLQHSQKLNFYYKIKTNYNPSVYLDLTRKNPSRKTLVKLRISSHKLRIETGRYDNLPRGERLCNLQL